MCQRIARPERLEIVPKVAKDPLEAEAVINNTSAETSGQRSIEEIINSNEARYRSLFNGSKNAIAVYQAAAGGEDFIFTDFNRTGERIEGINKGDLVGRRVTEVFPGVKEMGLFEVLQRVWRTGEPEELPVSFYRDDRVAGWKENYVYKLPSGEVVVIYDDVTERKQAEEVRHRSEEEAKRLAHEITVIAEIGRVISSTLNVEEVYKLFSEKVRELIPFDRIGITLNNLDENTHTIPYVEGTYVPGRQPGDIIPLTGMTVEKVGRTRKGLLLKMDSEEEIMAEFPGLLPDFRSGMRAGLTVPLISRDQVIGALALRSKNSGAYTERDLKLAESIGNQIAGAIANAQLFAKQKQMEESLRRSEERFRDLFDHAPLGYHEYDVEGRITNINRTELEMLGYDHEEVVGQPVWKFIVEEGMSKKTVLAKLAGTLPPGRGVERIYRRKDGSTFLVVVEDRLLKDSDGGIKGIRSVIQDITERKIIEGELRESEERYRCLFEMESDAIVLVDNESGQILEVNDAAIVLYGYSREEWLGMKHSDVSVEPDQTRQSAVERRTQIPLRCHRKKDGAVFPVEITARHFDWKGRSVHVAAIRDITKRKQAEDALRNSEEQTNQLARENAIIAEIGRIIGSTLDIAEVYERFAEEVRKLIPIDRLNINLIDYKNRTVTSAYNAGRPLKGRQVGEIFPLKGSVAEEVIRTRSGLILHPVDEAELKRRFSTLLVAFRAGYRSMMAVPLISKDEVIGSLYFGSMQPRDFTDRDLRLAENIGTQIAGAIANARLYSEHTQTEEALRENEQKLQELYDYAPVGYHEYDREGRITNVNRTDLEMLGYTAEEMIGQYMWKFNVEEELAREQILAKLAGTLPPARNLERTYRRKDGSTFPVLCQDRFVLDETGRITGIRCTVQDITEHKRAEEKMAALHRFQNEMLDTDAIWIDTLDPQGNITFWNRAAEYISGYSRQEVLGNNEIWEWLYPDPNYRAQVSQRAIEVIQKSKRSQNFETMIHRKDGEVRVISWCSSSLKDQEGKTIGSIVLGADITERKQAEEAMASLQEQLRQSQKMEAIGSLAGGIAHDFNNLLTVIKGYSQLSLDELKEGDPLMENLKEIWTAGNRASDLTRQLLAFSRRQVLEFKVVDLNRLIGGMEKMLRRMIGEDIELSFHPAEDLGRIKTDPGQMEQVIFNLAVNARDAMPSGGKLILEADNVYIDREYAKSHISVKPGRYVRLSVSDTGCGMTPEVRNRAFEPFFTTKGKEKGTGLGLSTVYGIVKQSYGNIWVYSEPGKGTTFKIYLPRVDERVEEVEEEKDSGVIPRGSETVLVVEDEEVVRRLAVRILKKQGYKVLEAPNSGEAFLVCEQQKESIHLILTDVVMPRMGGPEFIERLRQVRQDFKALYMSGYTDEAVVYHGVREGEMEFIQKPFTLEGLARKVREVLDK